VQRLCRDATCGHGPNGVNAMHHNRLGELAEWLRSGLQIRGECLILLQNLCRNRQNTAKTYRECAERIQPGISPTPEPEATHLGGEWSPRRIWEYRPKALPHDMRVRGLCRGNPPAQVQRTKEHTPKHTGDGHGSNETGIDRLP
jgi:hypothetical protein